MALLFELRGRRPGTAHRIPREGLRIGSDEENDLVLKDRDVKPFQLEVAWFEDRCVVKNLDPGGSVYLNGETFEETALHKGDILTVGEAMFRYVDPGETLSQEELWRPVGGRQSIVDGQGGGSRRLPFLAAAILVAVGIGLLVFLTQGVGRRSGRDGGEGGKLAELENPVDRDELKIQYERGKDLLAARRWDEAVLVLDEIRKQMPNFMDVESLYQEALEESRYVDLLNLGKGLMVEGAYFEAKAKMEEVPKKSVYYREAERLLREIEDRIVDARIETARKALKRRDWTTAKKEAESILSRYPNNKDARRLLLEARLLQRKVGGKEPPVRRKPTAAPPLRVASVEKARPGTEREVSSGRTPKAARSASARPLPKRGTVEWAVHRAVKAYRRGRAQQALDTLERFLKGAPASMKNGNRKKVAALIEDLREAETRLRQAEGLQAEGRLGEAVVEWERFLEKDRSITGGGGGVYFRKASAALGRIYFLRGKKEFDLGNPVGAAFFWNMGRLLAPKDEDLQKGVRDLEETAKKIYREGYSLQEINLQEAVEKWREVLMILPPDHPYHRKAKRRIARYGKGL